jgi:hypothetical protein
MAWVAPGELLEYWSPLSGELLPPSWVDVVKLMPMLLKLLISIGLLDADSGIPKRYECHRAQTAVVVDGRLDEAAWRNAPWTDLFVDIEGRAKSAPRFSTRVKMLWDDAYLYVGAEMEEPSVWATLTEHDSVIFHDNDFEVFLNPSGDSLKYFEFEINALNTSWDLFLPKPYRQDGKADNSWEIPGLKSAVHVEGTINRPGDTDRGWSVEIAFPWSAFRERSGFGRPRAGDQWRVNFSRVEWKVDAENRKLPGREDNWVWSPQGVVDMHRPETWGWVKFLGR